MVYLQCSEFFQIPACSTFSPWPCPAWEQTNTSTHHSVTAHEIDTPIHFIGWGSQRGIYQKWQTKYRIWSQLSRPIHSDQRLPVILDWPWWEGWVMLFVVIFLLFKTLFQNFDKCHLNLSEITGFRQNFTSISPECSHNFARISNWSALTKGDNRNFPAQDRVRT